MRLALVALLLAACTGKTSIEQDLCAKASAMFARCETFDTSGSGAAQTKELMVDRWRGLCRAVFTGETKQMMNNARDLYLQMDEPTKESLKIHAGCMANATTCDAYARCEN
jgi:hypothetical protein